MQFFVQLFIVTITAAICLWGGDYRVSCFASWGCIAALFIVNLFFRHRREKQLEEMIIYLMRLQDRMQLPELKKCDEGQIGILQSEIYKLVVLLQEQSNAATKEKNYLAGMLSDISHQIKTPIAAITIMTDLLMKPELTAEKRMEFAAKIDSQVEKITWLVRNLLTLSRLEADVLKLKREQVAVSELIRKACQPLEVLAEIKGVAVIVDCCQKNGQMSGGMLGACQKDGRQSDGIADACQKDGRQSDGTVDEIMMVCDGTWTAEAISNIIKNCIEHTPEGGEVRISMSQHNFATNITIKDNGCGIAKEDLPHVFERFYKGKYGAKDSVGIGLAMAKQIILRQNGVVSVESEEGKGAVFLVKMYMGSC